MSVQCSKQAASRKGAAISNLYKKLAKLFQKMPKLARRIYQFFSISIGEKDFCRQIFRQKTENHCCFFRMPTNFNSFWLEKV